MATFLIMADAMIVVKTGARVSTCRGPRLSIGTSLMRLSRRGIDRRPTSQSTPRRRTTPCGTKTIGLLVKPAARIVITSLSATSPYSWPIWHEHG